jgi:hypothetical protein
MKPLKRIRYYTMNSWNLSMAPAYNLKIHNVISPKLQDKVFEMLDCENFYDDINMLIHEFDALHDYQWQAGFNGRSSGYLVLYKGGKRENGQSFSWPRKQIEDNEVPADVLKSFRQLALDIVKTVEYQARKMTVKEEKYTAQKTRKIIA